MAMSRKEMRDEVDEFMDARDEIDMRGSDQDDSDDDMDHMPKHALELSMEEEDEEDDEANSDDESDEAEDDDDEEEGLSSWGTRKSAYYSSGEGDEEDEEFEDSDEEAALDEELEVKRLQKKRAMERSDADFADAFAVLTKADSKKSSATSLAADLHEGIHADLGSVGRDGAEVERVTRDVSQLSKQEKLDLIQRDAPELLALLEQFKEKTNEIREKMQPMLQQLKTKQTPRTSKGLSYLEVKYHLLLNYCINISFYLLLKAEGRSVKNHPVIEELVRIRVMLEKMRPLDQRLKYQIDKLLKMATLGENNLDIDPKLKHRPNVRSFMPLNEGAEDEEAEEIEVAGGGKYRAPKISAHVFEEEEEKRDKRRKKAEEKAKKSGMAQFLVEEFDDQPLQRPLSIGQDMNPEEDEDEQERIRYEEETFQRKLLSKKDRKKRKRTQLTDDLADLDDFSDLTAFTKSIAEQTQEADALESKSAKKAQREQQLAEVLNTIELQGNKAKRPKLTGDGDTDLPYLDELKKLKQNKQKREQPAAQEDRFVSMKSSRRAAPEADDYDDGDFSDDGADNAEDQYYAEVAAAAASKKEARSEKKREIDEARTAARAAAYAEMEEAGAEGKRKIDRQIEKNTGLSKKTSARKAKDRNPRVKRKVKYQEAVKRRKGAVQEVRDKTKKYTGEQTGIKGNVVRSVKLN